MFSQEHLVHQVLVSRHQNCGVWCQNQVPQPLLWFVFFFTNLFVKRTWLQSAMTWDFHVYKNYESESWSQRQWSSVEPDLWASLFELDQWQQSAVIRSGAEFMNWRTPSPLVMDILSSHWDLWDNWETKYEVQLSRCNIWDISLGIYLWK